MPKVWDFSSAGFLAGVREFFVSLLKTVVAAAGAFVLVRLANYHPDVTTQAGIIFGSLVMVARALISGFLVWVNTLSTTSTVTATVTTDAPVDPSIG